eukprot:TRINITY_DN7550_c7_g1_i1.p1 TRINITY_DN7550_c7_g1~~TRINITY_DN7550_c7_g1_i1.p1  ORF type:complete len:181 (+),score=31.25 TRINITY_DN7550_c7_g1_i1:68-544(+)
MCIAQIQNVKAPVPARYPRELCGYVKYIEEMVGEKDPSLVVSVYDAAEVPGVSIADYVKRWRSWCPALLPVSFVYVQRWLTAGNKLTRHNVHRVLLASLLVAAKWQVDQPTAMSAYTRLGGVCSEELHRIERAFLIDLSWSCYVSKEEFEDVLLSLLK